MSLTRQFFREMGPLFRMLEQPFGRSPAFYGGRRGWDRFEPFPDFDVRPNIDLSEQADKYVLDAEVPGVNKENIDIRVGDAGRSITIEGKVVERNDPQPIPETNPQADAATVNTSTDTNVATTSQQPNQISTDRQFIRNLQFTRTVWLPRPVDSNEISAKLENGVLTIIAKKAEDKASTSIPIQ